MQYDDRRILLGQEDGSVVGLVFDIEEKKNKLLEDFVDYY